MKTSCVCLLFIFLASHVVVAQKFSIRGKVSDSTGTALSSATVMLLSANDSTLVNFTVSNEHGLFELKNVNRSAYLLKVTFIGYKTYSLHVEPPASGALDLGALLMEIARTTLDEVVIEEQVPVTVKRDTIEFNAGSFKTSKNANVEDLLKKLPGVEVDNEGNITAQGEQVQRVTVDGKDFFGGRDPKLATRNLPADAIDKVQVLDRKSDQAVFTGVDDGERQKAINLELKEEKRRGAFGTMLGGYGNDDRFQAKANLNRFNHGNQFSFLGMGNNVNAQGFSMDDYMNFSGGSQQMMSGGRVRVQIDGNNQNGIPLDFGNRANGIMSTYAGGLNFNNTLNKRTEINGSYFYNYLDHEKLQTTLRENFLENGKFIYDELTQQNNTNSNHRASIVVNHKMDSVNSIRFSTNFTYNITSTNAKTMSENRLVNGVTLSENISNSTADGDATSLNSSLMYRHKFPKKGRSFSANVQFTLSETDRDGLLDAQYKYEGDSDYQTLRQRSLQSNENLAYSATVNYIEPLGNRKYLDATYSFRQNVNEVERPVYDINDTEEILNDRLSNQYQSDYQYHRAGLNFRMNRKKFTLTAGAAMQKTFLTGDLATLGAEINRSFQNFLPVTRFNYDFSSSRHLEFDYETSVQEPTIQQLQPILDNRDPLNLYQGNPTLKPAYQQSWRVHFSSFDPGTFIGFFAFLDVDYTTDAITNAIWYDNFIRTTRPVNVGDNLSINSDATLTFPINKVKSRVSVTANVREQHGINLLDDVEYSILQRATGGSLRYNYHYREVFDLSLNARLTHQLTEYEFDQPDQIYFNNEYAAEANLTIKKNYLLSSRFEYLVYENKSINFKQEIPILNFSVSRYFMKNKSGEIKLSANNVLDKALGINQTSSINYIERTVTNSLGRYFMISFIYSLNKQLNPMGVRREGGGMMRIVR